MSVLLNELAESKRLMTEILSGVLEFLYLKHPEWRFYMFIQKHTDYISVYGKDIKQEERTLRCNNKPTIEIFIYNNSIAMYDGDYGRELCQYELADPNSFSNLCEQLEKYFKPNALLNRKKRNAWKR